jgi:hypothetical protein
VQTINLEMASGKGAKLTAFLDGLAHVPSSAPGLQAYHAAIAVRNANQRAGTERRCAAVKKAVKQFNVMVSIATNDRGLPTVRLYSPIKQVEILL